MANVERVIRVEGATMFDAVERRPVAEINSERWVDSCHSIKAVAILGRRICPARPFKHQRRFLSTRSTFGVEDFDLDRVADVWRVARLLVVIAPSPSVLRWTRTVRSD